MMRDRERERKEKVWAKKAAKNQTIILSVCVRENESVYETGSSFAATNKIERHKD